MKLFVTFGYSEPLSDSQGNAISSASVEFDVPVGAVISYMGLEIEDKENPKTGRATIIRTPFHLNGEQIQPTTEYRIEYADGDSLTHDAIYSISFEDDPRNGEIDKVEHRRIIILDDWKELDR
jgi:hypothetical protein